MKEYTIVSQKITQGERSIMKYIKIILLLILIFGITACGRPDPISNEEMEQFVTDSQKILSTLETAFEQGRGLNYDEERNFVQYTVDYDKESEFQEAADDPSVSMVVTSVAMMELQLGKTDAQSVEDFKNYRSEFKTELAAVKVKVDPN